MKISQLIKDRFKVLSIVGMMLSIFCILFVLVSGIFYLGYAYIDKVNPSTIYIPTGSSCSEQVDILYKSGAISDTTEYINYLKRANVEKAKAGKYVIKSRIPYKKFINIISIGRQKPVRMIFTASRTPEMLAKKISRNIECDSATIYDAITSDSVANYYGFEKKTFMTMFVPNTYEVYWNVSQKTLFDRLKKEYDVFWSKDDREAKRQSLGMTREQVVTLASIVYEESKVYQDMRKIAGVYMNRLDMHMPLQACPTAKYAAGDWTLTRVLKKHTEIDSPYNTYKIAGLPPGPIVYPSSVAVDAVLNYIKSKDIYFCAAPEFNGTHRFAPTYAKHKRNARAYYIAYKKRKANN
ncbi:MAG: endolytic transglycosylase MltG [Bacteroidetes bacterium]|nr:endolytic transglycosylase MltG [Bacteroidota bacterium]